MPVRAAIGHSIKPKAAAQVADVEGDFVQRWRRDIDAGVTNGEVKVRAGGLNGVFGSVAVGVPSPVVGGRVAVGAGVLRCCLPAGPRGLRCGNHFDVLT